MSIGQKADSIRAAMRGILNGGASPAGLSAATVGLVEAAAPDKKPDEHETMTETAPAEESASDTPPTPINPPSGDDEDENDGKDKPKEDMVAAATTTANERWATVLRSPQAAGRTDAAVDLLAESTMSADKITALLGKLPAAAATSFDAKMKAEAPNPDVRPDGGQDRAAPTVATRLAAKHAPKKGN